MIGAKELILAGVDSASIVDEHDDCQVMMRAAGFDPAEITLYAEYSVQKYPDHVARCVERGMAYQDALIACFAAAYCEGALAAARAVRAEGERDG